MKTPLMICVLLCAAPGAALAQAAPAPGENRVGVVNGRLHHSPKRFETPQFQAQLQRDRAAKLARHDARREHRLVVRDGRTNHVPKAATSMMATADQ
jgi:hypothetical protein